MEILRKINRHIRGKSKVACDCLFQFLILYTPLGVKKFQTSLGKLCLDTQTRYRYIKLRSTGRARSAKGKDNNWRNNNLKNEHRFNARVKHSGVYCSLDAYGAECGLTSGSRTIRHVGTCTLLCTSFHSLTLGRSGDARYCSEHRPTLGGKHRISDRCVMKRQIPRVLILSDNPAGCGSPFRDARTSSMMRVLVSRD